MVLSSWQSHCESSPRSFDECRMAPRGRSPKNKPDDLGCESACTGCQKLHPPSPFIIITEPESWYSFYRPTKGRRLSRPSWLVTYRDGLPVHRRSPILVLTGSDVAQLRHYDIVKKSSMSILVAMCPTYVLVFSCTPTISCYIALSVSSLQKLLPACEEELYFLDMRINDKKSVCIRFGNRHDVFCAPVTTCSGGALRWVDTCRYLGIYFVSARSFNCIFEPARSQFYKSFNAISGKVGRVAPESVIMQENVVCFWEKLDFCYFLRILITWFVRYFSTTHLVK